MASFLKSVALFSLAFFLLALPFPDQEWWQRWALLLGCIAANAAWKEAMK